MQETKEKIALRGNSERSRRVEELREEIKKLELLMQKPDFWQNKARALEVQKKYSSLRNQLKQQQRTEEKYDQAPAILSIEAGAGGRDAEDWAVMLNRMYQKFCERKNWKYQTLSQTFTEGGGPEGRIGLKDISMEIKGKFSYRLLKKETGVHRLVRISPFSAQGLRHTSFAKVEVLPKIEEAQTGIEIRQEDLKTDTFRASGPGGQYVNRRETAVRITHLPTGIVVACQTERLQGENRKRAMQTLKAKLFQLQQQKREKELQGLKGKKVSAEFGSQIRSYVLHPYKLVKDLRTGVETSDVEGVLNGDLDRFIVAETRS